MRQAKTKKTQQTSILAFAKPGVRPLDTYNKTRPPPPQAATVANEDDAEDEDAELQKALELSVREHERQQLRILAEVQLQQQQLRKRHEQPADRSWLADLKENTTSKDKPKLATINTSSTAHTLSKNVSSNTLSIQPDDVLAKLNAIQPARKLDVPPRRLSSNGIRKLPLPVELPPQQPSSTSVAVSAYQDASKKRIQTNLLRPTRQLSFDQPTNVPTTSKHRSSSSHDIKEQLDPISLLSEDEPDSEFAVPKARYTRPPKTQTLAQETQQQQQTPPKRKKSLNHASPPSLHPAQAILSAAPTTPPPKSLTSTITRISPSSEESSPEILLVRRRKQSPPPSLPRQQPKSMQKPQPPQQPQILHPKPIQQKTPSPPRQNSQQSQLLTPSQHLLHTDFHVPGENNVPKSPTPHKSYSSTFIPSTFLHHTHRQESASLDVDEGGGGGEADTWSQRGTTRGSLLVFGSGSSLGSGGGSGGKRKKRQQQTQEQVERPSPYSKGKVGGGAFGGFSFLDDGGKGASLGSIDDEDLEKLLASPVVAAADKRNVVVEIESSPIVLGSSSRVGVGRTVKPVVSPLAREAGGLVGRVVVLDDDGDVVLPELQQPQRQVRPQARRRSTSLSEPEERRGSLSSLIPCPMCQEKYPQSEIEKHAANCFGNIQEEDEVAADYDHVLTASAAAGLDEDVEDDFGRIQFSMRKRLKNNKATCDTIVDDFDDIDQYSDEENQYEMDEGEDYEVNEDGEAAIIDGDEGGNRQQEPTQNGMSPLKGFVDLRKLQERGELGSLAGFFNQFSTAPKRGRASRGGGGGSSAAGGGEASQRYGGRKKYSRGNSQRGRAKGSQRSYRKKRGGGSQRGNTTRSRNAGNGASVEPASYNHYADYDPDVSAFAGAGEMRWEAGNRAHF
ncbi:UNVERIFIED_CONTAM: hypothetical protein HDU68_011625 [Siphonaria sp. JEL0065]|nr:hypothetical protein HDU68_011625 [Siphonaria sp. JEL0065]